MIYCLFLKNYKIEKHKTNVPLFVFPKPRCIVLSLLLHQYYAWWMLLMHTTTHLLNKEEFNQWGNVANGGHWRTFLNMRLKTHHDQRTLSGFFCGSNECRTKGDRYPHNRNSLIWYVILILIPSWTSISYSFKQLMSLSWFHKYISH